MQEEKISKHCRDRHTNSQADQWTRREKLVTDKQTKTNRHTYKQTNGQDEKNSPQTHKQTSRPTDKQTNEQYEKNS